MITFKKTYIFFLNFLIALYYIVREQIFAIHCSTQIWADKTFLLHSHLIMPFTNRSPHKSPICEGVPCAYEHHTNLGGKATCPFGLRFVKVKQHKSNTFTNRSPKGQVALPPRFVWYCAYEHLWWRTNLCGAGGTPNWCASPNTFTNLRFVWCCFTFTNRSPKGQVALPPRFVWCSYTHG